MSRESSIQNYIGKDTSTLSQDSAQNLLEEQFRTQERRSLKDREKTQEEIQVIELVNRATNDVLEKYGFPTFDIPINNVHIIEEHEWPDKEKAGCHIQLHQSIEMRERPWKIVMAATLFHEMLHFKSYNSVELKKGKIESFRTGLKSHTRPEGNPILIFLNEAIVSELEKRFIATLVNNTLFADEIAITKETLAKHEKLKNNLEGIYFAKENPEHDSIITADTQYYRPQRDLLWNLIEKIQQRNSHDFKDREDVFAIFANGLFNPNLLDVGRLIDRAFGLGTFRKIAKAGDDLTKLRMTIESL